jgi:transcriptional regulator with AAA-type ATPase domain
VVDEILDSIVRIPKELSESISSALDKGPLGPTGPHRIVDSVVKGVGTAIEDLGEGVAKGLDVPTKIVRR